MMDRDGLTPLERIELRDLLQDRWREQVQLITVLMLAQREVAEADDCAAERAPLLDAAALELAVERARSRLESVEQAMRRLDDGSYGWCAGCHGPIGFTRLVQEPDERVCDGCRFSSGIPSARQETTQLTPGASKADSSAPAGGDRLLLSGSVGVRAPYDG